MEAALLNIAEKLDWIRALTLRFTLSQNTILSIFKNRAQRLLALYLIAFTSSLFLSLFFPLALLLVGPLIYGFPHLFSSLRYVKRQVGPVDKKAALQFFTGVFILVSILRLCVDLHFLSHPLLSRYPVLPELGALIASFIGCVVFFRYHWTRIALSSVVLVPLVYLALSIPAGTVGFLLLIHNFVAFAYWIASSKSSSERRVAWLASSLFILANIFIFAGYFDFLYDYLQPQDPITFANLDYMQLGQIIFPWSSNSELWFHGVISYAFGQSLHYFVWMKAVPDQHHHHEIPTSFRQSLRLAMQDFGTRYFKVLAIFLVCTLVVWTVVTMPLARTIYFSISAYHGYLELAALGFLRSLKAP